VHKNHIKEELTLQQVAHVQRLYEKLYQNMFIVNKQIEKYPSITLEWIFLLTSGKVLQHSSDQRDRLQIIHISILLRRYTGLLLVYMQMRYDLYN
jgi:hypothetical protein